MKTIVYCHTSLYTIDHCTCKLTCMFCCAARDWSRGSSHGRDWEGGEKRLVCLWNENSLWPSFMNFLMYLHACIRPSFVALVHRWASTQPCRFGKKRVHLSLWYACNIKLPTICLILQLTLFCSAATKASAAKAKGGASDASRVVELRKKLATLTQTLKVRT